MKVALVVLDATRTDYLGPYGGDAPTPTLDALARQGVTFDNCFAGAPWTPASHATMFTGQYPSTHDVRADDLSHPSSDHWLPETLSDLGVTTQGIGAEPWLSRRQGFDRGFDRFHDTGGHDWHHYLPLLPAGLGYARSKLRCRLGEDDGSDRFDLHLFRQWADTSDSFTFANISVAHSPYDPPERFLREAGAAIEPQTDFAREQPFYSVIAGETEPTEAEWAEVERRYEAGIAHADYLLGKAVEALDDDTWLFVTADHGELLGESGLAVHQFSLREELVNVPLLVTHPSLERQTVDDPVHHVDLAPTIYDIAEREGYDTGDTTENLPGRSLLSTVSGQSAVEQTDGDERIVFAEYGPPVVATNTLRNNTNVSDSEAVEQFFVGIQAAITESFKLLRRGDGTEQFVRREDETTDVSEEFPEARRRLAAALDSELGSLPSVEPTELDGYVESDVQDRLEHLGYA
jgi:arylsulfatase A-like enzyme